MTREEFIKVLDDKRYPYKIEGDNLVITHGGNLYLERVESIPPNTEFRSGGYSSFGSCNLYLQSLKSIPLGTKFSNMGGVYLNSIDNITPGIIFPHGFIQIKPMMGIWFQNWEGHIDGIDSTRLLNKMVSIGLFNR
jgi:hypothetical protein